MAMRPALKFAIVFAALSFGSLSFGLLGVFQTIPGLWHQGWPVACLVDGGLSIGLLYYVAQTGGFRS